MRCKLCDRQTVTHRCVFVFAGKWHCVSTVPLPCHRSAPRCIALRLSHRVWAILLPAVSYDT